MIYNTRSDIVKAVEYQSNLNVGGSKSRLYYCTAWIIKPDFSDFLILQSYSTMDHQDGFTSFLHFLCLYSQTLLIQLYY